MIEYRYILCRSWARGDGRYGTVCWVMLNPSTADDATDDQTIRKITHLSREHGFSELVVVNLFAIRATKPHHLLAMHRDGINIYGPDNHRIRQEALDVADTVVIAWGAHVLAWAREPDTFLRHLDELHGARPDVPILCCGRTKDGHPKHPCYLPNNTKLVPW